MAEDHSEEPLVREALEAAGPELITPLLQQAEHQTQAEVVAAVAVSLEAVAQAAQAAPALLS